MKRIDLKLKSRSYSIYIENGLLKKSGQLIREVVPSRKAVILSVPSLFHKYGVGLVGSLRRQKFEIKPILIPDGEAQKNTNTLLNILKKMARYGLQRDSCLITLGGGVVGDMGGLAAALYMRGIPFVQIPTTLLAQVDASIGGKTAIDFYGVKNLIGSFYQPRLVLIDPSTLNSLDDRQMKTGLAEIIKYGIIWDVDVFDFIESHLEEILKRNKKALAYLISRSCEIKSKIVSEDEKENGKRAWLNYGHTLGHALEAHYRYRLLTHGEAIAYGMWFAALLSWKLGMCSRTTLLRQVRLLNRAGLFKKVPRFSIAKVYEKMLLDKKSRNGKIQFVLTRKIGLVTIPKIIPRTVILSALTQIQAEAIKSF